MLRLGTDPSVLKIVDSHVTVGPGDFTLVVKMASLKKEDIDKICSIAEKRRLTITHIENWLVIYRPHYEFQQGTWE